MSNTTPLVFARDTLYLADLIDNDSASATYFRAAAAELRRQHAEIERLSDVVSKVDKHCDHLGIRLGEVMRERDALREALKGITPPMPPIDASCHYGLVQQEECAHCRRIAKAHAAIDAAKGGGNG